MHHYNAEFESPNKQPFEQRHKRSCIHHAHCLQGCAVKGIHAEHMNTARGSNTTMLYTNRTQNTQHSVCACLHMLLPIATCIEAHSPIVDAAFSFRMGNNCWCSKGGPSTARQHNMAPPTTEQAVLWDMKASPVN